MLLKIEVLVLILIGVYTIISIMWAVVNLKQGENLKRRMKRLERAHVETKKLAYTALWNTLEQREKFEPMKEGESCGSISLDGLQD